MDYETYLSKINELESECNKKKLVLMREFVRANNFYKIGDIVTDHIGAILIEKIRYSTGFLSEKPCAVYYGVRLNKDGTPNKRGKTREVWQSNLI